MILYVPICVWCYAAASKDGVLAAGAVVLSIVLGALAMASVIAALVLQKRFRYADV